MKKDVIYIDTEDDITAIIGRVKSTKTPIVALVPPKRVGVLQSVVNLKLLKRAADQSDKRIVLITSDSALAGLAAGLALPVAKNLQSKPEVGKPDATDSPEDDVIQGEEVAIDSGDVTDGIDLESDVDSEPDTTDVDTRKSVGSAALTSKKTGGPKLPDFNKFRKKLFVISGAVLLFVGFLVWAIVFAPRADVIIKARTNIVNINKVLQVRSGAQVDTAQNVLPSIIKQVKKTETADVTATGKKDVGEKATGTVKLSNSSFTAITLNAGAVLRTSEGMQFTTNNAVTVPKGSCVNVLNCSSGSANVGVTAAASGPAYNGATGNMSGVPSDLTASLTAATAGGTTKEVTIISQEDVDKAAAQLKNQDANAVREELKKQFEAGEIAISEAFIVEPGSPAVNPGVGQEASTAKLSLETTYTLVGVKSSDLSQIYSAFVKTEIANKKNQKIYEVGEKTTKFSEFTKNDSGYTLRAVATAQVGPNVDQDKLKKDIAGMREGDVREKVNSIDGIEDVDVKFSPFWVKTVPSDTRKVHITFSMVNGN